MPGLWEGIAAGPDVKRARDRERHLSFLPEQEHEADVYVLHCPHGEEELSAGMRLLWLLGSLAAAIFIASLLLPAQEYPADVMRGKPV
jgi:hypothetical protein